MSGKSVERGATSAVDETQEQIMLDWDVAQTFKEEKVATVQAQKTGAVLLDAAETVDMTTDARTLEQARGVRLLEMVGSGAGETAETSEMAGTITAGEAAGANETLGTTDTLGEAGTLGKAEVENDVMADESEVQEGTSVDTVLLRAEQALGHEQFYELIERLNTAVDDDTPDEVMRKFRAEAEKCSRIDAADLWEAVLEQAKRERFEKDKARVKFYRPMKVEDLAESLQVGALTRKDGESNALKSDLKMSVDAEREGEWKSGFEAEKCVPGTVVLVLDGAVIDEPGFVALGGGEVVSDKVDLKQSCLGVVCAMDEDYAKLRHILKENGGREIPIYLYSQDEAVNWANAAYEAGDVRAESERYAERVRRTEWIERQVLTEVDKGAVAELVAGYAERMTEEDINKLYEECDMESFGGILAAAGKLVSYYTEILDLGQEPAIQYDNNPDTDDVMYTKRNEWKIIWNLANCVMESLPSLAEKLGHESWHLLQIKVAREWRMGAANDSNIEADSAWRDGDNKDIELEDNEGDTAVSRGELYEANFNNYVASDVSLVGNATQLVEMEAYQFSTACRKKFDEVEKRRNSPIKKVQRQVRKASGRMKNGHQKGNE